MLLEKWYLDALFPDGTVWFGYRAWLRFWKFRPLHWCASHELLPDGTVRKVSHWTQLPAPARENGAWNWTGPDSFTARWKPTAPGIESVVADDEDLHMSWKCVAPRASVERFSAGTLRTSIPSCDGVQQAIAHGTGYLECLRVQSTRAGLPFRNLWWGRAHAGESNLVWLRWKRGRDLSLSSRMAWLCPVNSRPWATAASVSKQPGVAGKPEPGGRFVTVTCAVPSRAGSCGLPVAWRPCGN